jgi:SNF2 family DNA or RNA helicase
MVLFVLCGSVKLRRQSPTTTGAEQQESAMNSIESTPNVNEKPLLFIENQKPYLKSGQTTVDLADTPLARWRLKANLPALDATPEGAAWFNQQNPLIDLDLSGMRSTLLPYQRLGVQLLHLGSYNLFFDMGLGKCITSIAYAISVFNQTQAKYLTLVICPTSVFVSWSDELAKHLDRSYQYILAHGPKAKKRLMAEIATPSHVPTFIITSYETLGNILNLLGQLPIAQIFADESSKMKNLTAARTKSAHALKKTFPNALRCCLSGTPSTTNPLGFFSQFEFLGEQRSGFPDFKTYSNNFTYSKWFARCKTPRGKIVHVPFDTREEREEWLFTHRLTDCTFAKTPGPRTVQILNYYPKIIGFKNLEQLREITHKNAYCLKKSDVAKDLPPKSYVRRAVDMNEMQKEAYAKIADSEEFKHGDQRIKFSERNSPYAKLHQIAQGFLITESGAIDFGTAPKFECLLEIMEEAGDQKIIVWAAYRHQIGRIVELFKIQHDMDVLQIHGGVPVNNRSEIVHMFAQDPDAHILVANPDVAGMGLNLTCASLEVFMSIWFKADVRTQAEDRCHRIGQAYPVTIIDVLSRGTMEAALLANTMKKIDVENTILSPTGEDDNEPQ